MSSLKLKVLVEILLELKEFRRGMADISARLTRIEGKEIAMQSTLDQIKQVVADTLTEVETKLQEDQTASDLKDQALKDALAANVVLQGQLDSETALDATDKQAAADAIAAANTSNQALIDFKAEAAQTAADNDQEEVKTLDVVKAAKAAIDALVIPKPPVDPTLPAGGTDPGSVPPGEVVPGSGSVDTGIVGVEGSVNPNKVV